VFSRTHSPQGSTTRSCTDAPSAEFTLGAGYKISCVVAGKAVASIEALAGQPREALAAVSNLCVSNAHGSIEWYTPTNLSGGCGFRELVHIMPRQVDVYPDGGQAQAVPVGNALNKPAHVTLHNVHPKATAKQPGACEGDYELHALFKEKVLKPYCKRSGSLFISYDNGTWQQQVPHF